MILKLNLKERALGWRRRVRSTLATLNSTAAPEIIRDQIFSPDQLSAHARDFAHRYYANFDEAKDFSLLKDLPAAEDSLDASYFALAEAADNKEILPSGSEWILDNYHVIEEHMREVRKDLPRGYYKTLPHLRDGPYAGKPRVLGIAVEYLRHRDSVFDGEMLSSFVAAYQELHPLSIGELWAIPIMLRLVVLKNLSALAEASLRSYRERKTAEEISEEVLKDADRPGTEMVLNLAKRLEAWPGWLGPGAIHIMRRLRAIGLRTAVVLHWIEERFRESGIDPDELVRTEQYARAADQISIGNCVTSLRAIALFDWKVWVEKNSKVHEILKRDAAGAYEKCDFATRDRYRHEIERLARFSKSFEPDVAAKLLEFVSASAPLEPAADAATQRRLHVGTYLLGEGRIPFEKEIGALPPFLIQVRRFLRRYTVFEYLGSIVVLTGFFVSFAMERALQAGLPMLYLPVVALLFALVASNLAIQLVQWLVTMVVNPTFVPKLDFEKGVDESVRTVVTVHSIFSSREAVQKVIEAIEVRFLANDDPNVSFALLADVGDSDKEDAPGDEAIIEHASELMAALTDRYKEGGEGRFFLLFRKRLWNPGEGRFMGWERKRGKISEFNRLLAGSDSTTFKLHVGDMARLRAHRYVITLDADTQLPRGIAARLIGTIHHPLNRAIIDPQRRAIVKGYGIIQPRVGISLRSAVASRFSSIFCGQAGIDPYTSLISEVYQDLFREASYVGKGIYDPHAFEAVLENRVPENSLLSHDLFESIFARTAHVSDVELIDDFPSRYNVYARREHRWIRGDWQLFPWLFPFIPTANGKRERSPLNWLGWWKIFDNMRRSLVAPAAFLLLVFAFTIFPMWPFFWFSLVLGTFLFPILSNLANSVLVAPPRLSVPGYSKNVVEDFLRNLSQALFQLSVLPHQAYLVTNAMCVTLWRIFISRRHLLEWETAYHSEQRSGKSARDFARSMSGGLILTTLALAWIALRHPDNTLLALPLMILWLIAPAVAAWISRPAQAETYVRTAHDEDYLVRVARQTWAYFDDHLIEEYHYLIPDNIQMVPSRVVAERTSPTNIGLSLLALMTAHDLGFAAIPSVATRINKVFRTLLKLERWNGHFLNWYDIRSLKSLAPRYVSAVDSGNLVGHLMALSVGLTELLHAPLISSAHWRQLRRAFGVLVERQGKGESDLSKASRQIYQELKIAPRNFRETYLLLDKVKSFVDSQGLTLRRLGADAHEQDRMQNFLCELAGLRDLLCWYSAVEDFYTLMESGAIPDLTFTRAEKGLRKILLGKMPTLALLVKVHNRINELLKKREIESRSNDARVADLKKRLRDGLAVSVPTAEGIFSEIDTAGEYAKKIVSEMNLAELYDANRKAFVIGYNLDRGARDSGHYDLLASEARLTSFVAIALGEVPQQHWFMLGRPITESFGGRALLSWGGTMFEYFMPLLVMRDYPGTLLSDSYRAVIRSQAIYGRMNNVPWGMSESGYAGVDFHKTYQYKAFGVPGLGLKRGLSEDLVISPYSTFLALPIAPRECLANLNSLDTEGVHGEYGFYEAIDYTPQRLSEDERGHVVRNFLAHHQGMSLVSINNYLNNGVFQQRFHSNVAVKATELLLHEKFPVAAPALVPHRAEQLALDDSEEGRASRQILVTTPHTTFPFTRVLSNGYYSVMVDNAGSGFSMLGGSLALTRWREDPAMNTCGTYVFLRDLANQVTWSAAYQPTRTEPDWYEAIFDPAKVEFRRRDVGIVSHTEVVVSPDDHVEIRRVTLTNTSRRARTIEATSYAEVALNDSRADVAHPAFSKMFVQSEFIPELETILFWRRLRSAREEPLFMFHMLTMPICWTETGFETSREAFLGRGRDIHTSRAMEPNGKLLRHVGAVLDPIFSLRTNLELEPGGAHSVVFVTGVAKSREEAVRLAQRYREVGSVNRAFELAMSHSTVELRHQQFSISQAHAFQRLANALLFNVPSVRAENAVLMRNQLAQSGLWRFGISGDLPIVLLRVSEPPQIKLVNEMLLAHEYLRLRGIVFDLVVLNEYPGGYFQHFQEELEFAVKAGAAGHLLDKRGGIFLRVQSQLSDPELVLLQTVSRVILHGAKGSLSTQLAFVPDPSEFSWAGRSAQKSEAPAAREAPSSELSTPAMEKKRGFVDSGRGYRMNLPAGEHTPLPWSNVVANPRFGFLVTESGGGYTWSENSRENRLTPWSNDPVSDPCGEALYIRDMDSGSFWSATPAPTRRGQPFEVTHGFGYSTFKCSHANLESALVLSGSPERPVKWWALSLRNEAATPRNIELTLYLEWVLGVQRDTAIRHVVTSYDEKSKALIARNYYNNEFAGRVVAVGSSLDLAGY
ncbi:MAG: cyclic beta 1-2 glucan synthetase, partial [Deltaproteobacteria bacterium]|nr:cyclic beta 1-2 glucan synthetase [Deltaproteobacteria bacterium]